MTAYVATAMKAAPEDVRVRAVTAVKLLRQSRPSRQQKYMGVYWNRRMVINSAVAINKARTSVSSSSIPVDRIEIMDMAHPFRPTNPSTVATTLADVIAATEKKKDEKYWDEIALDLDQIAVASNGEVGRAEIIVVGGASDGTADHTKGLITAVRRPGDDEVRKFNGPDRIAAPWWPLTNDGRSSITFYGEVWELDKSDREDIVLAVGGVAGLAQAIITGLVAGGVIGGPAGAIAGAIVGALVGLVSILMAFNDDDYWGAHEVNLFGPYSHATDAANVRIARSKDGDGYEYRLDFIRKLREV